MIVDLESWEPDNGTQDDARRLRARHSSGTNVLFCDGHVKWLKAELGESFQLLFEVP
jgi:prepilin-type processing-associated H-X9-DG protein